MSIRFFNEDNDYQPTSKSQIISWLTESIETSGYVLKGINYILCSDSYLLEINQKYLNHHDYTDIITFDQSENEDEIEADIYISVQRVKENSEVEDQSFDHEFRRVLIHGILHLMGYSDKSSAEKADMRKKEDSFISLFA